MISQLADRPQRSDLLGIACSTGCALHCAAMPVVASVAPSLGWGWLSGSLVHQLFAMLCTFFNLGMLVAGILHKVLIGAGVGLQTVFIIFGSTGLLAGMLLMVLKRKSADADNSSIKTERNV